MREIPDLPVGITPMKSHGLIGGGAWLYRFDNGLGGSVIRHSGSYGGDKGLYELMVTQYTGEDSRWDSPSQEILDNLQESEPCFDGSGIAGWLTLDDVARILGTIRGWSNPYITG